MTHQGKGHRERERERRRGRARERQDLRERGLPAFHKEVQQ